MNTPRANEGGAVAVLVALLILPLTLLMAFAIDTGNWWTHKRHLQTQADAGAFAGAQGPWFPTCDETAIYQGATGYSGGSYNQQYQPSGAVHVLVNSTDYFENGGANFTDVGTPCATLAQASPGHPAFLDVKATESNLSNFFGSIPGFSSVTPHTHARVEIQGVKQERTRPIAVRNDALYQCANAKLWNTTSSGTFNSLLATFTSYTRTVLSDSSTQFQITGSATMPVKSAANASQAPHVAVQILLGNTNCANTDAYADPDTDKIGVNFIDVYRTGLSVGGGQAPKLGSVSMPPGLSDCTPDPYFSVNGCNAVVKAYVVFGSGAVPGSNAFITINGVPATPATDSGGQYWTASVPIPSQSGPNPVTIAWEKQFGSVSGATCKSSGNPKACKGSFGVAQQVFAATDDEDITNSGQISLVQIADGNGQFANSLEQGTAHSFTITVRVKGLQNSSPTDPPTILKVDVQRSKRTGLIDCGQGNGSGDIGAIVDGCPLGVYIWPEGSQCVLPKNDPIDCVNAVGGNRRGQIIKAMKDRINGGCDYWNAYRDSGTFDIDNYIVAADPRLVQLIVTSPADLSGNVNGDPIPVRALASFYITGYDGQPKGDNGKGCENETYPGIGRSNFKVWGHWIKYVPLGGIGNGQFCDQAKFGDCMAVLTQ